MPTETESLGGIHQQLINNLRVKPKDERRTDRAAYHLDNKHPVAAIVLLKESAPTDPVAAKVLRALLRKEKQEHSCQFVKEITDELDSYITNNVSAVTSNPNNKNGGIGPASYGRVSSNLVETKEVSENFGSKKQNVIAWGAKSEKELGNKPKLG